MTRAPISDEELKQWADFRADDAGHLARELMTYRIEHLRSTPPTADSTSPDLLQRIVLGLDGVTGGEWADQWDGDGGAFISGAGSVIADMVGPRAKRKKNAEHIARCSPDTMREIAAYVRELEAERDHYAKGEMAAVEKGHEHFHRATAAEATVTALQEALETLLNASEAFHDAACSYFSDGDYDRDGVLANAEAELSVAAIPAARTALSQIRSEK